MIVFDVVPFSSFLEFPVESSYGDGMIVDVRRYVLLTVREGREEIKNLDPFLFRTYYLTERLPEL